MHKQSSLSWPTWALTWEWVLAWDAMVISISLHGRLPRSGRLPGILSTVISIGYTLFVWRKQLLCKPIAIAQAFAVLTGAHYLFITFSDCHTQCRLMGQDEHMRWNDRVHGATSTNYSEGGNSQEMQ